MVECAQSRVQLLSGVDAVVFDVAGTVLHPRVPMTRTYWEIGQQFGSRLSEAVVGERFTKAFEEKFSGVVHETSDAIQLATWQQLVADVFPNVLDRSGLFEALWEFYACPQNWTVYEDVMPVWDDLKRRGLTVVLASNFDRRLHRLVAHREPLGEASYVFCSADLGVQKPDRRFFELISDQLEIPAARLLMVGDHPVNDFDGAIAAGWQACLIDRRGRYSRPNRLRSLLELLPESC